jgi:hypothetical protein
MATNYRVRDADADGRPVTGIDYPGGHAEPGDVVKHLPASSAKWLMDQGYIEPTKKGA